jgi:hypothetical protein
MGDPRIDALMPALEKLPSNKVRELLFFLVGLLDGNTRLADGIKHWLETE